MTQKERELLDRRHGLTWRNIQIAVAIECRDAVKRRQKSKVLKTSPALLEKPIFVSKVKQ